MTPKQMLTNKLAQPRTRIGVAIVAFRSAPVIIGCLDSLLASEGPELRVVITDNASDDETLEVIRKWAADNSGAVSFEEAAVGELAEPIGWLTLLRSPVNGGFAYATNRGLELLLADTSIDMFWLLNPDCRVLPGTAAAYVAEGLKGAFSLLGGRTLFEEHRTTLQTDGGRVSRWTGTCQSVNWGQSIEIVEFPQADTLDYITGANCIASRPFINKAGLMTEDYFLYYEEVDWAFKRGELPIRFTPDALVYHYGGTTIGSGSVGRSPSPFSNYFNHRNRIKFLQRFRPIALPFAYFYSLAKAGQLFLLGKPDEAIAVLAGVFRLTPPKHVSNLLSQAAQQIAFPTD